MGNISVSPLESNVSNIIFGPWENNVGNISVSPLGSNIILLLLMVGRILLLILELFPWGVMYE